MNLFIFHIIYCVIKYKYCTSINLSREKRCKKFDVSIASVILIKILIDIIVLDLVVENSQTDRILL